MIGRRAFLLSSGAAGLAAGLTPGIVPTRAFAGSLAVAAPTRWKILPSGSIAWDIVRGEAHRDFVEMAGEQMALVIRYGVDKDGLFSVDHDGVWPMLRFRPNFTDNHLQLSFGEDADVDEDPRFSPGAFPRLTVQVPPAAAGAEEAWRPLLPKASRCIHDQGIFRAEGMFERRGNPTGLSFRRTIFPSTRQAAAFDRTLVTNESSLPVSLAVDRLERVTGTPAERGVYGAYETRMRLDGAGSYTLKPGESLELTMIFEARRTDRPWPVYDVPAEEEARKARAASLLDRMQLETPDPVLDTAFAFAKIRTAESIFQTKAGPMHAPGGGLRYYAAIWANDQAEYANPFFAMLGDPLAAQSAINSFRHFARFMNEEYRPIPSSITGEGDTIWHGAGDRGDMAMIAYGAGRFALAYGEPATARELWPLIAWCLEYLRRKVTPDGVIASDSDELEGRFPAGKANLSTSALAYDALRSAAMLGRALGKPRAETAGYDARAIALRSAIERHFGARVEGFETYRYFDRAEVAGDPDPTVAAYAAKPDILRAWIAIPLTMDIYERKAGTIDALFSPRLWTADGLATEAGQTTIWDRATLYGLRGTFAAGETRRGLGYLLDYSRRRLLGDHVPYPFEAYPEGNKAQLAAESALYCRIFTEGLFGIRPTGFASFDLTPRLPEGWPRMALSKVKAFGTEFDIAVARAGGGLTVTVAQKGKAPRTYRIARGETIAVRL